MTKYYSLVGIDGNAYAVLGYVKQAMRECGKSKDAYNEYYRDATSGDYSNLINCSIAMLDELNEERKKSLCTDIEIEDVLDLMDGD